jgi:hypothetical protein
MDQFYFNYEWTPALRRRARIEIEKIQRYHQLEAIDAWIRIDALCLVVMIILTVHGFFLLDQIEALQMSLVYDAIYLMLLTTALVQVGMRLNRLSRNSLKEVKNQRIRSRWWTILIAACLIPVNVAISFFGMSVPSFVLYPSALAVHELLILGSDFRQRRRVIREIHELQLDIQEELPAANLSAVCDSRAT